MEKKIQKVVNVLIELTKQGKLKWEYVCSKGYYTTYHHSFDRIVIYSDGYFFVWSNVYWMERSDKSRLFEVLTKYSDEPDKEYFLDQFLDISEILQYGKYREGMFNEKIK